MKLNNITTLPLSDFVSCANLQPIAPFATTAEQAVSLPLALTLLVCNIALDTYICLGVGAV